MKIRPRTGSSLMGRTTLAALTAAGLLGLPSAPRIDSGEASVGAATAQRIAPSDLWLTASGDTEATRTLARATTLLSANRASEALPLYAKVTSDELLGGYARLYMGRSELALMRFADAARSARIIIGAAPGGALGEAALWLLADASEDAANWTDAVTALQALADLNSSNQPLAFARLGRAAVKAGQIATARAAFRKVYYDYPLSAQAADIEGDLRRVSSGATDDLVDRELSRAQALYAGRRYPDARDAFQALRGRTTGDTESLVALRIAQCDFALKKYAAARDELRAYLQSAATRQVEAQFAYLGVLRELGREDEYQDLVRTFVEENAADPLAETALNDLATHFILANDDARAAAVFTELYQRFPHGAFADRAAWKAGWWAYKLGNYPEAIRLFTSAAEAFPRADYRPSWLYWTARAQARLNNPAAAADGFARVLASYRHSYYGREAVRQLAKLSPGRGADAVPVSPPRRELPAAIVAGSPPPNARLIRALLAATLYDDAIGELRKAQALTGTSPFLEASIAYALNAKGELRPAITAMRRAYPQFMADGGDQLPRDILMVIFPIRYWDLVQKYAPPRRLDPYVMAALMAQESTFQADVRSSANAWGLMQLQPSTGRQYAARLGIRRFTTKQLTDPEINIRMGMAYFADLVADYGDVVTALAAYNAGPNRAARWRAERPGVDQDEFIDDIPFPETQNYVKRIIGTAEDYRLLYGKR
jgi:soluble lytic murein transglycosylase